MHYAPLPVYPADNLTGLTDTQLIRLQWRVYTRCLNRYGVSSFDLPTFSVLYPECYAIAKACHTVLKSRK